jgi:hypothetical protein
MVGCNSCYNGKAINECYYCAYSMCEECTKDKRGGVKICQSCSIDTGISWAS